MNQNDIFGFVHYTSELLQQFDLAAGSKIARRRLRPYMNIPVGWADPPEHGGDGADEFHRIFQATDVFVVEVSSVRKLRFKTAYLQINRVRELLVDNDDTLRRWWNPLVRTGENHAEKLGLKWPTPVQNEVASTIWSGEQGLRELIEDLRKVKAFLRKPVLFVSHFNVDYNRAPIAQRKLIVDAIDVVSRDEGCYFFDPTSEVLGAGLENAIQDLGHYRSTFEPFIADRLNDRIHVLLNVRSERRESIITVSGGDKATEGVSLPSGYNELDACSSIV